MEPIQVALPEVVLTVIGEQVSKHLHHSETV